MLDTRVREATGATGETQEEQAGTPRCSGGENKRDRLRKGDKAGERGRARNGEKRERSEGESAEKVRTFPKSHERLATHHRLQNAYYWTMIQPKDEQIDQRTSEEERSGTEEGGATWERKRV